MGTADGPKLLGITTKSTPDKLATLVRHPTAKMREGGMDPTELNDEDMKALIAYLASLK